VSRWLIVRHAETPWNLEGKIQGHTDISLSERGFQQAEALRTRLAACQINAAYASDLKRTMETAQTVLKGRKLSPSPSPELREFAYGRWEGMTHKEVEEADPKLYSEMMKRSEDFAPPGGESLLDLMVRVGGFVSRLKEAHSKDDTLLITGHGGSLRVLLTCLLSLPPSAAWSFLLDSASLSVVDCHPDNAVLRLLNDTSHYRSEFQATLPGRPVWWRPAEPSSSQPSSAQGEREVRP